MQEKSGGKHKRKRNYLKARQFAGQLLGFAWISDRHTHKIHLRKGPKVKCENLYDISSQFPNPAANSTEYFFSYHKFEVPFS